MTLDINTNAVLMAESTRGRNLVDLRPYNHNDRQQHLHEVEI